MINTLYTCSICNERKPYNLMRKDLRGVWVYSYCSTCYTLQQRDGRWKNKFKAMANASDLLTTNVQSKDWTIDKLRTRILNKAYNTLLSELTIDKNANIMVTGGRVCLQSEMPRLYYKNPTQHKQCKFPYNKMYIHEVNKKIFKYLSNIYLPTMDPNNKALVFNRNIYTSDQVNVSFISNDVHGTSRQGQAYISTVNIPLLWARQISMALINKKVKEVAWLLNTATRIVGVDGYKTLISKCNSLLKQGLNIELRKVFMTKKCYNKTMWTIGYIANAPDNITNESLIKFSNKIQKVVKQNG